VASPVKLPRLGQGMESGTVVRWLKDEGETVAKGDLLYELDTEKVTQEVEAEVGGTLLKIAVREGEVPVGTTLAFIGEPGEAVAEDGADAPAKPADEAPAPTPAEPEPLPPAAAVAAPPADVAPRAPGERVKASPLARRLARERGVDLGGVNGTGPEGRIVAEDVERLATGPAEAPAAEPTAPGLVTTPATPGDHAAPLSSIRKTIARRLTEAWTIPVFQLVISADMTESNLLLARRRELDPNVHLTVTDLLVTVVAAAVVRHPEVNVSFTDDGIVHHAVVNVGIAAATDRGLMVPVVHGAERLTLTEVARIRADVVDRAREGKLHREDVEGGTFTISNLGMFGLDQFTAVLNPPEAAILAVGATLDRVVPRDGELVVRPMMTMTLTCDHRAVDGAPAAAFLESLKKLLEEPALAL
jgi:pyruvate dehydrogenase E2 component (dihydrolipoyllysine-residue acetyltransferase)